MFSFEDSDTEDGFDEVSNVVQSIIDDERHWEI